MGEEVGRKWVRMEGAGRVARQWDIDVRLVVVGSRAARRWVEDTEWWYRWGSLEGERGE